MAARKKRLQPTKKIAAGSPPVRPPIVAVMGHVDHGKTTLLSAIKRTDLTRKERGGITQHIGAYQVEFNGKKITFIDTPGHEAFAAMRARGGQAADIVVLVVAADEGVKPQTQEAIDHARAAAVPILVAINKIDLPAANAQKTKEQLAAAGVVVEDWGGDVVCVEVSAKRGKNLKNLLEMILLVAEMAELKGDPRDSFEGVVIEAKLDPKRGPLATLIVKAGSLAVGDSLWAGGVQGRVKAMRDGAGAVIDRALPADPVEVLGFGGVPAAGALVAKKPPLEEAESRQKKTTLENFQKTAEGKRANVLNLVLKSDALGTLEALRGSLLKLETEKVQINFLHAATGDITASDVLLAKSNEAVIVGFNVRLPAAVRGLVRESKVQVRLYGIIYELLKDIDLALRGLLAAEAKTARGRAEVIKLFPLPSGDVVLGCKVLCGKLKLGDRVKISRAGEELLGSRIKSMKIKKGKVAEASAGAECGLLLKPAAEFRVGDSLEVV